MKYTMFLLLFFPLSLFASDRPVWTIDSKKWNLPQRTHGPEAWVDPRYRIQFTPDDKVLISFFDRRPQTELATKDTPEKSGHFFVALLLSRETGELIRRVEWPVIGESGPSQQFRYGSRISPLRSGGYVGIFNRRLQVLDSSFNVIHERILETSEQRGTAFEIITPLYGQFFIFLSHEDRNWSAEIIDSKTFKIAERLDEKVMLMDIWGDRLLATWRTADVPESRFFEKRIGASQWNDLVGLHERNAEARYIYNGTIIVTGTTGGPDFRGFWFSIEDGKKNDPASRGLLFKPSLNTSIVASKRSHLSAIRRMLDLNSMDWIEAYDLSTQQVLLATRRYSAEQIRDYAISPDGMSIVLMTINRIELYTVPPERTNNRR